MRRRNLIFKYLLLLMFCVIIIHVFNHSSLSWRTHVPTVAKKLIGDVKLSRNEEIQLKLSSSYGDNFKTSAEYRLILQQCNIESVKFGKVMFYDDTDFRLNPWYMCAQEIDILIAVHVRTDHRNIRNLIRKTYGSMTNVFGWKIKIVFVLGSPSNAIAQQKIENEFNIFGDILQRDFIDSYQNLTRKHLGLYDWMLRFCTKNVKYLLRVDEDAFINIFQVVKYLKVNNPKGFYCKLAHDKKPLREENEKSPNWYATYEEYKNEVNPTYCFGVGYILPAKYIRDLYWCSVYSKYDVNDDVHISGILASRMKLKRQDSNNRYKIGTPGTKKPLRGITNHLIVFYGDNEKSSLDMQRLWDASVRYSYLRLK